MLDSESITHNPSQNRETAHTNIQSYSFKMLQKALDEGIQLCLHRTKDHNLEPCVLGGTDLKLSNVHNVQAPKYFEKSLNEGLIILLSDIIPYILTLHISTSVGMVPRMSPSPSVNSSSSTLPRYRILNGLSLQMMYWDKTHSTLLTFLHVTDPPVWC